MRNFFTINYIIGVILTFIGFIMYNFAISNDCELILAALTIGIGFTFLLTSFL